ncbi:MAG: 2-C-methyl-D-erythritol 2,4-cyclodiphosphate synthase [Lentisphaerae bacterium]|nr:2-C-methyl-D-erythritol 2,4-cyclodiphosphate synthase [Lentisphaerota bacterium]
MITTGLGFDAHRFVTGRRLVLGGVELEYDKGLEGHSDADVLCHALSDALLGSVSAGDIGIHFPDTDPKWKGADSIIILENVAEIVRSAGAEVVNVDAVVMAEQPKLFPYIAKMRERIAKAIGINVDFVSVKASTLEQMGALGRGEGIGVLAIATVKR